MTLSVKLQHIVSYSGLCHHPFVIQLEFVVKFSLSGKNSQKISKFFEEKSIDHVDILVSFDVEKLFSNDPIIAADTSLLSHRPFFVTTLKALLIVALQIHTSK